MRFAFIIEPPFNDSTPAGDVVGCDVEVAARVARGEVDAYASVLRAHEGFLHRSGLGGLRATPVPGSEAPASPGAFAVAKGAENRVAGTDAVLAKSISTPTHRSIMARWGFTGADVDRAVQQT